MSLWLFRYGYQWEREESNLRRSVPSIYRKHDLSYHSQSYALRLHSPRHRPCCVPPSRGGGLSLDVAGRGNGRRRWKLLQIRYVISRHSWRRRPHGLAHIFKRCLALISSNCFFIVSFIVALILIGIMSKMGVVGE